MGAARSRVHRDAVRRRPFLPPGERAISLRTLRGTLARVTVPLLAGLLAACSEAPKERAPAAAPAAIRIVDDAGDTVALAAPARRIVSLNPASTELLFAVGAGPALVGRSQWCDWPAEAARLPSLGDAISPSLEAIVARRPDLVVLYPSGQNAAAARRLRSLGIAVAQLRTDLVSDVPRLAPVLGALAGRRTAGDSLARAFEAELDAITEDTPAPGDARPTVFLLVWDQPPMTVGRGSFLTELIERAGGRNVFADLASSAAAISIEAVTARDPDLVLVTSEGDPSFARRPEWASVPAVRERRFVRITGSQFNRPGPRVPAAVRELAGKLRAAHVAGGRP